MLLNSITPHGYLQKIDAVGLFFFLFFFSVFNSLISVAKRRNAGSEAVGRCPGAAGRNYIRASGGINMPPGRDCSSSARKRLNEATVKYCLLCQSMSRAGIRIKCLLTGCQT